MESYTAVHLGDSDYVGAGSLVGYSINNEKRSGKIVAVLFNVIILDSGSELFIDKLDCIHDMYRL